ncbi:MAG: holo-ACP synthase [Actinomycetota bacterium]|nr:holo-ACP synthase [Actinomycetota bacterium]
MTALLGVGVDAVEIDRMRSALGRTQGLAERLFTPGERTLSASPRGHLRPGNLAGRFAAKEAVAKALGTGVRGFGFRDIEVLNDAAGKPYVRLHAGAAHAADRLGVARVEVSITTSRALAIANAVASGGGEGVARA